jgi:hypothetical protein
MIYPSNCGAWENGGHFLEKSLHVDIFDIIEDLREEIEESVTIVASAVCVRPAVVKGDRAATRFVEEPQSRYRGRDSWIHRGIDPRF